MAKLCQEIPCVGSARDAIDPLIYFFFLVKRKQVSALKCIFFLEIVLPCV